MVLNTFFSLLWRKLSYLLCVFCLSNCCQLSMFFMFFVLTCIIILKKILGFFLSIYNNYKHMIKVINKITMNISTLRTHWRINSTLICVLIIDTQLSFLIIFYTLISFFDFCHILIRLMSFLFNIHVMVNAQFHGLFKKFVFVFYLKLLFILT